MIIGAINVIRLCKAWCTKREITIFNEILVIFLRRNSQKYFRLFFFLYLLPESIIGNRHPMGTCVYSTAVYKAGRMLVDSSFIVCRIWPSEDPNDSLPRRVSRHRPVISCRLFVAAALIGCCESRVPCEKSCYWALIGSDYLLILTHILYMAELT